jgi:type IV secretory pathway component VirB8
MRSLLTAGILLLSIFSSCTGNDSGSSTGAENDVDAARNFIRAALDGQYNDAKSMIVADSVNLQYLDAFASNYRERMSGDDKRGYRESSITIHNVRQVNDSVTVINYSNSYKKTQDSIKVVLDNNNWLVDLKYSFPDTDLLP